MKLEKAHHLALHEVDVTLRHTAHPSLGIFRLVHVEVKDIGSFGCNLIVSDLCFTLYEMESQKEKGKEKGVGGQMA